MIDQFDGWLTGSGTVALVIKEPLEPVTGVGTAFFPPTFAPPEGAAKGTKADYIIDENKVCLVDTVGSQGNRLEPLFKKEPLNALVPQVTVRVGERQVNLLDAGHRAADAIVRFSTLGPELQEAFLSYRDRGDAAKLARISPTSLVFGAWDSRGTGAKIPRLVESTIRAYGVERLTRSAQYFAALNDEERTLHGATSEEGLLDTPSGRVPGGVIAREGIRRDATLNMVALRALGGALELRRYILGLALVAFLAPAELYLRQGCLLVAPKDQPAEIRQVTRDGLREPVAVNHEQVVAFAKGAALAFGVGENREVQFEGPKEAKEGKKKGKS
jgi:CRISPR-associated protein Csb1